MLDLRTWNVSVERSFALPIDSPMQSISKSGSDWYISQAWLQPDGLEHSVFSKFSPDGYMGKMTCESAGHGTFLAFLPNKKLMFDWNGKLVQTTWRNQQITRADPSVTVWAEPFQVGAVWCVTDLENEKAVFYHRPASGTREFRLRYLSDIRVGVDKQIGNVGPLPGGGPLFQGMASWNNTLLYLQGHPDTDNQSIIGYDMTRSTPDVPVYTMSIKRPELPTYQEPEGIFISGDGVITGNPLVYIGYYCHLLNEGDTGWTRYDVIMRYRDPKSVLVEDLAV